MISKIIAGLSFRWNFIEEILWDLFSFQVENMTLSIYDFQELLGPFLAR